MEYKRLLLAFTVPGTPVPKGRPRIGKAGHTYTPRETTEHEGLTALMFRSAAAKRRLPFPLARGINVRLELTAYLPDDRTRDWDNIGKLVSDALNKIAYADDKQVRQAEVILRFDKENPRTEVALYLLEEQ